MQSASWTWMAACLIFRNSSVLVFVLLLNAMQWVERHNCLTEPRMQCWHPRSGWELVQLIVSPSSISMLQPWLLLFSPHEKSDAATRSRVRHWSLDASMTLSFLSSQRDTNRKQGFTWWSSWFQRQHSRCCRSVELFRQGEARKLASS